MVLNCEPSFSLGIVSLAQRERIVLSTGGYRLSLSERDGDRDRDEFNRIGAIRDKRWMPG